MAPTMDAPVVRLIDDYRHLDALKWGLVPYFTKDPKKARKPINARSETIAKSGMFKAACAEQRRCLVPAPAYYEWRDDPDGKTLFAVARIDGDPVVFGGIWERWQSAQGEIIHTFATITTDANQQLAGIQDRMPVIIERQDWPLWLGEAEGDPSSLLRPAPEDALRVWPVGKAVGNFRNDGPSCSSHQLLRSRRQFDVSVTICPGSVCDLVPTPSRECVAMADDEVSMEDLIAIERVAQKLWEETTKGTTTQWEALSVLAKQAWRNRARMEVTIWSKSVGAP